MDLKLIKNILDMIAESDVNEVSLEEGDFKIKVKKQGEVQQVAYTQPAAAPQAPAQPSVPAQPQQGGQPQADQSGSDDQPEGDVLKSPIVGTFYEAPSPDSDPFVKVGDKISKGDTICIVEAMKIMNEIEAEFGGTVQKILVDDGTPVEFDQPLFIIKKD
ncbi:MAG: acetyl-CoA carboxylase, biotin carboxyl carrier protein [Balneola sp.]|nr:acetyl-CoA carboxylase, biotin carboxyl carrier protein [Balneola sp.]|tara:strand:- start:90673 stop:91152 length:480 start_codon:yes stop_codon:yes gene_type:complete